MAGIELTIDSSQLDGMSRAIAKATGQFKWIAARAMTNAAKTTKADIAGKILPMVEGGATGWTRRGLIATFAKPDKLQVAVGFQYGAGEMQDYGFTPKGIGVPAGRYMEVNARGGGRQPKSTERALRRTGVIPSDRFITPAKGSVPMNGAGNVSGGTYQQLLSRLRALPEGSSQNAKRGAPRRAVDYFVMRQQGGRYSRWQLGADPVFIAKRVGKRGFKPAFFITEQPEYRQRFPIQSVAMRAYQAAFPKEFNAALDKEIAYQVKKYG